MFFSFNRPDRLFATIVLFIDNENNRISLGSLEFLYHLLSEMGSQQQSKDVKSGRFFDEKLSINHFLIILLLLFFFNMKIWKYENMKYEMNVIFICFIFIDIRQLLNKLGPIISKSTDTRMQELSM